jgi:3-phenylpropionate/trans-cinnamate dioxygenase ferredoxin reductase component
MSNPAVVVIGAGQAGLQICDSLRKGGYEGGLVLIGEEPALPYQRPPLSKEFLKGAMDPVRLQFRPADFYEKIDVDLRLDQRVTAIDRQQRCVELANGHTVAYEKLALATGTRVRPLQCPGEELDGIHYLRTVADSGKLKDSLAASSRIAVIGGGFIGLEVAAVARGFGKSVIVVEALERLMARAVSPVVSEFYKSLHRERGVELHFDQTVQAIRRDGSLLLIETGDDAVLEADIVVVGIGVVPNVELAEQCGLECRNGIVVDERARTSDPNIVAAGDCTMHYNGLLEREIRLESVQNAVDQAKVAAATLRGEDKPYRQVPWFWSDQYDVKLQIAGIGTPHDEYVVRGEIGTGGFSVFYYRNGRLIAADSINRPADHMACRKLLAKGKSLNPDEAGDLEFNLVQAAKS